MSVRTLLRTQLPARLIHVVAVGAYGAGAALSSGWATPGLPFSPSAPAFAVVGAAGFAVVAGTVAEIALFVDVSRNDGDVMLVSGERVSSRALGVLANTALFEVVALALLSAPLAVLSVLSTSPFAGVLVLAFGLLEAVMAAVHLQARRSRRAFLALKARRPSEVLAAYDGLDLRHPARWNDAMIAGEAWAMTGAIDRALHVIGPHVGQHGVALREGFWRLAAEPAVAKAALVSAPRATPLDKVRASELEVWLAVREGRGADVVARVDSYAAEYAPLPPEYGDGVRLALIAAAGQAGRDDVGRAVRATLARPLADHAYIAHAVPFAWGWVDPERSQKIPATVRTLGPAGGGDAFAPPASDPPAQALIVQRYQGAEPVPSLPVGVQRSPARRVFALVAAGVSVFTVAPVLIVLPPTLWMAATDPEMWILLVTLVGTVSFVAVLGVAELYREWLHWRPATGTVVVLRDGTELSLSSFKQLGVPTLLERLTFSGVVLIAGFAILWPYGLALVPVAALLWRSLRPFTRGRAVTIAALEGDDARVVALCRTWLAAWAVAPVTRSAVEVQLAVALARQGDAAGAAAAVQHTDGIPEARYCRAWLAADRSAPDVVARGVREDEYGWWRMSATAVAALAAGSSVDTAAVEAQARRMANPYGDLLWLLLALDRPRDAARALLGERGVDPTRFAWVAAVWPKLAVRYAGIL